jgi:hypothetical protein
MVTDRAGFVRNGTGWTIGRYITEHIGIASDSKNWFGPVQDGPPYIIRYRVRVEKEYSSLEEIADQVVEELALEPA